MSARLLSTAVSLLAVCALSACGSSSSTTSTHTPAAAASSTTATSQTTTTRGTAPLGPEAIPLEAGPPLAPASSMTQGATVDGVQCAAIEQLAFHIHAHLQVYIDGRSRALPGGIGIVGAPPPQQTPDGPFYGGGQCLYWLHTHTLDGIIHVESPITRVYTLGNFFDEWRQPLGRTQVASAKGKVTAYLNGKPWKQDPRAIPLLPHASIQLDVGTPIVAPKTISWAASNL